MQKNSARFLTTGSSRKQLHASKLKQPRGDIHTSRLFEKDRHFLSFASSLSFFWCLVLHSTELEGHVIGGLLSVGDIMFFLIVLVYDQGQRQYFRTKIGASS